MKKRAEGSNFGDQLIAGLTELAEALEAGEPLDKRFTVRTVKLNLSPRAYTPADVKSVRKKLGASQPLLARFLGVSVKTIRSWEQGLRPVPAIAARYLDDIMAFPEIWTSRIQAGTEPQA
ncbi:hypothetical protein OJF2_07410 [Aquisphaera giovannonii]|uniref:HTH cro/C1-type domain-containing protein n=1 Tax=Aquisphaera giovannonii TaxID=406548 RepID=A0A5B9VVK7_9BACT|nr:transcriptional regulator [Aquisphaera giovannonii]QEH32272.1 hypothetical protein OJF2_07410 [Aquisphaera giovannonii]